MDVKKQVLSELDSRLDRLNNHRDDRKPDHGNQFEQLNHAVSDVIGASLTKELENLRDFVNGL